MRRVNSLEDARARLRDGATSLISPPYAACHAGVGYYQAFVAQLVAEFPETKFYFTLCCGNNPAMAHEALRAGFTSLICATSPEMLQKLRSIAAGFAAEIQGEYPHIADERAENQTR